jgi:hypothetical protein
MIGAGLSKVEDENRPNLYTNPYFNDLISHNIGSNREVVVYADD